MKLRQFSVCILALSTFFLVSGAQADVKLEPKISSFDLFVDHSGSMMMRHNTLKTKKMKLAREALQKITAKIPPLPYQASLHTFAPYTERKAQETFSRSHMEQAINGLSINEDIYTRTTPFGDDIHQLRPTVTHMPRKGAILIFSDGMSNVGSDPIEQAKALYAAEPGICLHIVSFADKASGQNTLKEIARLNTCSVYAEGTELLSDEMKLDAFMQDIFYRTVEAAPMQEEVVIAEAVENSVAEEEIIVLRNVNFAFDSAQISKDSATILSEAALLIADHAGTIVLTGHTDSMGNAAYNMKLSQKRAQAVRNFFIKEGLAKNRFVVRGKGEEEPEYTNDTREGRVLNRRVEITFE